jgi:fucose 4-O-acetylase-like acetyltransferase
MGAFFFLSGYFSSLSLKRKSRTTFLKAKLIRLGLPTLLFTFLGKPLQLIPIRLGKGQVLTFENIFLGYWRGLRGVQGPVWYCAVLVVFDALYAFLPDGRYNFLFGGFERIWGFGECWDCCHGEFSD